MNESLKIYWELFVGFVKPGLFGFGGGPASIPFIQKEVVENYQWMENEEFLDMLALGNTLPGPITTKLAAIVGYKVGGVMGIVVAITGMVLPTAILVILLTSLYIKFKNVSKIESVVQVLRVVVIVLLLQVTWELGLKEVSDKVTIAIFVVTVIGVFIFKFNPLLIIALAVIFGLIFL
ncbi:chromate transporter [Anaerobacillus sp. MEB173]|uniref:chromate transporter n=1 Tax=Anaerobacillus sp. MEB173 TaxID=3383345 RepID=UPI003F8F73AC